MNKIFSFLLSSIIVVTTIFSPVSNFAFGAEQSDENVPAEQTDYEVAEQTPPAISEPAESDVTAPAVSKNKPRPRPRANVLNGAGTDDDPYIVTDLADFKYTVEECDGETATYKIQWEQFPQESTFIEPIIGFRGKLIGDNGVYSGFTFANLQHISVKDNIPNDFVTPKSITNLYPVIDSYAGSSNSEEQAIYRMYQNFVENRANKANAEIGLFSYVANATFTNIDLKIHLYNDINIDLNTPDTQDLDQVDLEFFASTLDNTVFNTSEMIFTFENPSIKINIDNSNNNDAKINVGFIGEVIECNNFQYLNTDVGDETHAFTLSLPNSANLGNVATIGKVVNSTITNCNVNTYLEIFNGNFNTDTGSTDSGREGKTYVGGFAGLAQNTSMSYVKSIGTVTFQGALQHNAWYFIGGLIGAIEINKNISFLNPQTYMDFNIDVKFREISFEEAKFFVSGLLNYISDQYDGQLDLDGELVLNRARTYNNVDHGNQGMNIEQNQNVVSNIGGVIGTWNKEETTPNISLALNNIINQMDIKLVAVGTGEYGGQDMYAGGIIGGGWNKTATIASNVTNRGNILVKSNDGFAGAAGYCYSQYINLDVNIFSNYGNIAANAVSSGVDYAYTSCADGFMFKFSNDWSRNTEPYYNPANKDLKMIDIHNFGNITATDANGLMDNIGQVSGKTLTIDKCGNSGYIHIVRAQQGGAGVINQITTDNEHLSNSTATITNCYNKGKIEYDKVHTNVAGGGGGIAGVFGSVRIDRGEISGLFNAGEIVIHDKYYSSTNLQNIGGVIGFFGCYNFSDTVGGPESPVFIKNCYNQGNISVTQASVVGGVLGVFAPLDIFGTTYDTPVILQNSYNLGTIEANQSVGGIIGGFRFGGTGLAETATTYTIENCVNYGASLSTTAPSPVVGRLSPADSTAVSFANFYSLATTELNGVAITESDNTNKNGEDKDFADLLEKTFWTGIGFTESSDDFNYEGFPEFAPTISAIDLPSTLRQDPKLRGPEEKIYYYDENHEVQFKTLSEITLVITSLTAMPTFNVENAWYVIEGDVDFTSITINASSHFILSNNSKFVSTMNATDGIFVGNNKKLYVYDEVYDSYDKRGLVQTLRINFTGGASSAINIYGGILRINPDGTALNLNASGIGGGANGQFGGDINIFYADVVAFAGTRQGDRNGTLGAGIGSGSQGSYIGNITIKYSSVTAVASTNLDTGDMGTVQGAGIGVGAYTGDNHVGDIGIFGSTVSAMGSVTSTSRKSPAIGGAYSNVSGYDYTGDLTINGGTVRLIHPRFKTPLHGNYNSHEKNAICLGRNPNGPSTIQINGGNVYVADMDLATSHGTMRAISLDGTNELRPINEGGDTIFMVRMELEGATIGDKIDSITIGDNSINESIKFYTTNMAVMDIGLPNPGISIWIPNKYRYNNFDESDTCKPVINVILNNGTQRFNGEILGELSEDDNEIADVGQYIRDGSGTEDDPYLFDDLEKLKWTIEHAPGGITAYYKQIGDIEYEENFILSEIIPAFAGHLDGDGHKIRIVNDDAPQVIQTDNLNTWMYDDYKNVDKIPSGNPDYRDSQTYFRINGGWQGTTGYIDKGLFYHIFDADIKNLDISYTNGDITLQGLNKAQMNVFTTYFDRSTLYNCSLKYEANDVILDGGSSRYGHASMINECRASTLDAITVDYDVNMTAGNAMEMVSPFIREVVISAVLTNITINVSNDIQSSSSVTAYGSLFADAGDAGTVVTVAGIVINIDVSLEHSVMSGATGALGEGGVIGKLANPKLMELHDIEANGNLTRKKVAGLSRIGGIVGFITNTTQNDPPTLDFDHCINNINLTLETDLDATNYTSNTMFVGGILGGQETVAGSNNGKKYSVKYTDVENHGNIEFNYKTTQVVTTDRPTLYCSGITGYAPFYTVFKNAKNFGNMNITYENDNKATVPTIIATGIFSYSLIGFSLDNCLNYGNIEVQTGKSGHVTYASGLFYYLPNSSYVNPGGVVGYPDIPTVHAITNCGNYGIVSAGAASGLFDTYYVSKYNAFVFENNFNKGNIVGQYLANGLARNIIDNTNSGFTPDYLPVLKNSYNQGDVILTIGTTSTFLSGLFGQIQSARIMNCFNSGNITAEFATPTDIFASGIVGNLVTTYTLLTTPAIMNCYNIGNVIVTNSGLSRVGGLVSRTSNNRIIKSCYNAGIIQGIVVGGILGGPYSRTTASDVGIYDCLNYGEIVSEDTSGDVQPGRIVSYDKTDANDDACFIVNAHAWKDALCGGAKIADDDALLTNHHGEQVWRVEDLHSQDNWVWYGFADDQQDFTYAHFPDTAPKISTIDLNEQWPPLPQLKEEPIIAVEIINMQSKYGQAYIVDEEGNEYSTCAYLKFGWVTLTAIANADAEFVKWHIYPMDDAMQMVTPGQLTATECSFELNYGRMYLVFAEFAKKDSQPVVPTNPTERNIQIINMNPELGGTANFLTASGTTYTGSADVKIGDKVSIQAITVDGVKFVKWVIMPQGLDLVSDLTQMTPDAFDMPDEDLIIFAFFAREEQVVVPNHTLTILNVNHLGIGYYNYQEMSLNGKLIDYYGGSIETGKQITIQAIATPGAHFVGWQVAEMTSGYVGPLPTAIAGTTFGFKLEEIKLLLPQIDLTKDVKLVMVPVFEENVSETRNIQIINMNPELGGTANFLTASGTTYTGSADVKIGDKVSIQAITVDGVKFVKWVIMPQGLDLVSDLTQMTPDAFDMPDEDLIIFAFFAREEQVVVPTNPTERNIQIINMNPELGGTANFLTASGTTYTGSADVKIGDKVSIQAITVDGVKFVKWVIMPQGLDLVSDLTQMTPDAFDMPDEDLIIFAFFAREEQVVVPTNPTERNIQIINMNPELGGTANFLTASGTIYTGSADVKIGDKVSIQAITVDGVKFVKWVIMPQGLDLVSDLTQMTPDAFDMPDEDLIIFAFFAREEQVVVPTNPTERNIQIINMNPELGGTANFLTASGTTYTGSADVKIGDKVSIQAITVDGVKFVKWVIMPQGLDLVSDLTQMTPDAFDMPDEDLIIFAFFAREEQVVVPTNPTERNIQIINMNPELGGTANFLTASGTIYTGSADVKIGDKVSIQAITVDGVKFVKWVIMPQGLDLVSDLTQMTPDAFDMPDEDLIIFAFFAREEQVVVPNHTLTILNVNHLGIGYYNYQDMSLNGKLIDYYGGSIETGKQITIQAIATPGAHFVGWQVAEMTSGYVGPLPTAIAGTTFGFKLEEIKLLLPQIDLTKDVKLVMVPVFEENVSETRNIQIINMNPELGGTANFLTASGTTYTGSADVKIGDKVSIQAITVDGVKFVKWVIMPQGLDLVSDLTQMTPDAFDMPDEDLIILAFFAREEQVVVPTNPTERNIQIINMNPELGGTANFLTASGTTYTGSADVKIGDKVSIQAITVDGVKFVKWVIMPQGLDLVSDLTQMTPDAFDMPDEDLIILAFFAREEQVVVPTNPTERNIQIINMNPELGGTANFLTASGTTYTGSADVKIGDKVSIQAITADGVKFVKWVIMPQGLDLVSDLTQMTPDAFDMPDEDLIIFAFFAREEQVVVPNHTLTILNVNHLGIGYYNYQEMSLNGKLIDYYGGSIETGKQITIQAIATPGAHFVGWQVAEMTSGYVGPLPTAIAGTTFGFKLEEIKLLLPQIDLTKDVKLVMVPVFEENIIVPTTYAIDLVNLNSNFGDIYLESSDKPSVRQRGRAIVSIGAVVTIVASAFTGAEFVSWETPNLAIRASVQNTNTTNTFNMISENVIIYATFFFDQSGGTIVPPRPSVEMVNGNRSIGDVYFLAESADGSETMKISTWASVRPGQTVTIVAIARPSYYFGGWDQIGKKTIVLSEEDKEKKVATFIMPNDQITIIGGFYGDSKSAPNQPFFAFNPIQNQEVEQSDTYSYLFGWNIAPDLEQATGITRPAFSVTGFAGSPTNTIASVTGPPLTSEGLPRGLYLDTTGMALKGKLFSYATLTSILAYTITVTAVVDTFIVTRSFILTVTPLNKVQQIAFSTNTVYLTKNAKLKVPLVVKTNGAAKKFRIEWTASKNKVASVSNTVKKSGYTSPFSNKAAAVVFKAGKLTGSSKITFINTATKVKTVVTVYVVSKAKTNKTVKISGVPSRIYVGQTVKLKATWTKGATGVYPKWMANNSNAKISPAHDGTFVAMKAGKVTIYCTVGKKKVKKTITILARR